MVNRNYTKGNREEMAYRPSPQKNNLGFLRRLAPLVLATGTLFYPTFANETPVYTPQRKSIEEQVRNYKNMEERTEIISPKKEHTTPQDSILSGQMKKISRYRDLITESAEIYGVDPNFMVALSLVENSNVDPRVEAKIYSKKYPWKIVATGGAGLYQFTRRTARGEGLRVDNTIDERLDPTKAIPAAARYISRLQVEYDDLTRLLEKGYHGKETIETNGEKVTVRAPSWYAKNILNIKNRLDKGDFSLDHSVPTYTEELERAETEEVREGDTLFQVIGRINSRREKKISRDDILHLNPELADPNSLPIGYRLKIPKNPSEPDV